MSPRHAWIAATILFAGAGCGRVGFVGDPERLDAGSAGGDSGTGATDGGGDAGDVTRDAGPAFDAGPPRDAGPAGPTVSGGGIVLARAWGAAPNAPAGTPRADTIELAWESRPLPPRGQYAVVRDVGGVDPDRGATTACTSGSSGPCRACLTARTDCVDDAVAAAPARYRYTVVVVDESGAAMTDADDARFAVDVPVPPADMVLLHRASVNREMCDVLGAATDPSRFHRCTASGPGAVPLRAHPESPDLGLEAGFYDFGYDLFVDRWETACGWTHESEGGRCGAGGAAGNCVGPTPASDQGVAGNVFYSPFNGRCFVRTAAGWGLVHLLAVAGDPLARAAYTNDPGAAHDRPPLGYVSARDAQAICAGATATGYGAKRVWRLRELIAAGAFERLAGDPQPRSPSEIDTIEAGLAHSSSHACNVRHRDGVVPVGFDSGDELARDDVISPDPLENVDSFVIGSVATSACVSRYGVQDLIGNVFEALSDELAACGTGTACVGIASSLDAGNRDLEGLAFDGTTGVGPGVTVQPLDGAARVLVSLGVPLVSGAPFGVTPSSALAAQFRNDTFDLFAPGAVRERMGIGGGSFYSADGAGRFHTDFGGSPTGDNIDPSWGMRCVVAAVPR